MIFYINKVHEVILLQPFCIILCKYWICKFQFDLTKTLSWINWKWTLFRYRITWNFHATHPYRSMSSSALMWWSSGFCHVIRQWRQPRWSHYYCMRWTRL